jgi:hypothetical protein
MCVRFARDAAVVTAATTMTATMTTATDRQATVACAAFVCCVTTVSVAACGGSSSLRGRHTGVSGVALVAAARAREDSRTFFLSSFIPLLLQRHPAVHVTCCGKRRCSSTWSTSVLRRLGCWFLRFATIWYYAAIAAIGHVQPSREPSLSSRRPWLEHLLLAGGALEGPVDLVGMRQLVKAGHVVHVLAALPGWCVAEQAGRAKVRV